MVDRQWCPSPAPHTGSRQGALQGDGTQLSRAPIPNKSSWGHKTSPRVWAINTNTDKHNNGKKIKEKEEEDEEEGR